MKIVSKNLNNSPSAQHGVTLIEVLVTVLILAIGGLGVASLQLAGLKYSSGSYARTQAVILADDIANRLKSNRSFALDLDDNDDVGTNSPYTVANFGATVTSTRDCLTDNCSQAELATYDLATWLAEIARVLPAGQGRIRINDAANPGGVTVRRFDIGLQWRQVANSTSETATDNDEVKEVTFRVEI